MVNIRTIRMTYKTKLVGRWTISGPSIPSFWWCPNFVGMAPGVHYDIVHLRFCCVNGGLCWSWSRNAGRYRDTGAIHGSWELFNPWQEKVHISSCKCGFCSRWQYVAYSVLHYFFNIREVLWAFPWVGPGFWILLTQDDVVSTYKYCRIPSRPGWLGSYPWLYDHPLHHDYTQQLVRASETGRQISITGSHHAHLHHPLLSDLQLRRTGLMGPLKVWLVAVNW